MPGQVFRATPQMPVGAMKTYQILAPRPTHWRPTSCANVDCPNHLHGWITKVDESTDLGKQQAWYIRNQSGRKFTEDRNTEPGITLFTFEAGQTCFRRHQERLDVPELFIVRGGDWRGNPTGDLRRHESADDWVEDFGENQLRLADQIEKG